MIIESEVGYLLATFSLSCAGVYLFSLLISCGAISDGTKSVKELREQKKEIEEWKITAVRDTNWDEWCHAFFLQQMNEQYLFDKKEAEQFLNVRGVLALIGYIFSFLNVSLSTSFVVVMLLFLFLSISAFYRSKLVSSIEPDPATSGVFFFLVFRMI